MLVQKQCIPFEKSFKPAATQPFIQPKLTIGAPNDSYEQEADSVADKVMRMAQPGFQLQPMQISSVQRKCDACEEEKGVQRMCAHCEEEEKGVQRKETEAEVPAGKELDSYVNSLDTGGTHLPVDARTYYEPRFGYDFSRVRIHTDSVAAKSAKSINALAYTSGNNIVFGSGQYSPETDSGKRLLGHELTHVVQQSNAVQLKKIQRAIGDGHDLQSARFSGDPILEACFDNENSLGVGSKGGAVEKVQQALIDLGFSLPNFGADSDFGVETQSAVQSFQQSNALTADGIVGSDTLGVLDSQVPSSPQPPTQGDRELTAEELAAIVTVAQAAVTPDGNTLGPTDATHRGCLGNRFFFRSGTFVNTPTADQGVSAVTARLGQPPGDAANCSCGCGLFRQFIRGFWRAGSPTAAKQFNIGSCGNTLTMNESTFTEEFVNCITGNLPIGPGCTRTQGDAPGI